MALWIQRSTRCHDFWTGVCRKNTFSGIMYKNDPAIMGYGLFNEPRCPASQSSAVRPADVATAPCSSNLQFAPPRSPVREH